MVNLNQKQEDGLEVCRQKWRAHIALEMEIDAELAELKVRRMADSTETLRATFQKWINAGVPMKRIHEDAMGMKDRKRLLAIVRAPSADGDTPAPAPVDPYETNGTVVTVRLVEGVHRQLFETARTSGGFAWEWATAVDDPELSRAHFDGVTGEPITEDYLTERFDRHPLVVLYTSYPALRHDLLAAGAKGLAA